MELDRDFGFTGGGFTGGGFTDAAGGLDSPTVGDGFAPGAVPGDVDFDPEVGIDLDTQFGLDMGSVGFGAAPGFGAGSGAAPGASDDPGFDWGRAGRGALAGMGIGSALGPVGSLVGALAGGYFAGGGTFGDIMGGLDGLDFDAEPGEVGEGLGMGGDMSEDDVIRRFAAMGDPEESKALGEEGVQLDHYENRGWLRDPVWRGGQGLGLRDWGDRNLAEVF